MQNMFCTVSTCGVVCIVHSFCRFSYMNSPEYVSKCCDENVQCGAFSIAQYSVYNFILCCGCSLQTVVCKCSMYNVLGMVEYRRVRHCMYSLGIFVCIAKHVQYCRYSICMVKHVHYGMRNISCTVQCVQISISL